MGPMTQAELARKAELTEAYVSQLLRGKRKNPSLAVLRRIAKALGLTIPPSLLAPVGSDHRVGGPASRQPPRRPSRTTTPCGRLPAVSLLTDLDAFSTEHRCCGDLDAGVDGDIVWMACDCGAP
jgi:transcriptional regulator with XRE-family HTH domain